MNKSELNLISKASDLRLYIIENTIHIDELISQTLSYILNIEWTKSKSFGYGSSSLSFNQKVQLIQDIKSVDTVFINKLTILSNIRNKFAHINEVDSFEKLFEIAGNGNKIRNSLNKWYLEKINEDVLDEELKYQHLFFQLIKDVGIEMTSLLLQHANRKGTETAEKEIYVAMKNVIDKLPNGNDIRNKIVEKIKVEKHQ